MKFSKIQEVFQKIDWSWKRELFYFLKKFLENLNNREKMHREA